MLKFKITNLLRNFGWMLVCYFIFFAALGLLQAFFPQFDLKEYQQNDINRLLLENPFQFFLLAVIVAPVVEEGMFRSLINPSPNELIFFLSCWCLVIISIFVPEDIYWLTKFSFLTLFLLFSSVVLRELIPIQWQWKMSMLMKKYHIIMWLLTSFIFGMVHIFNYVEGLELNFVLFLLIFPRIIAGFFFGKVKLENRTLAWPMLMHSMNNGMVLFLVLLAQILETYF